MSTWTQAEVDTLKAAVASGVLTVSYEGPPKRMITYQSLAEMRDLLDEMTASVGLETGARTKIRRVITNKGL